MSVGEQVGTRLLLLVVGGRSGSEQVGAVVAEVDVDVAAAAGCNIPFSVIVEVSKVCQSSI